MHKMKNTRGGNTNMPRRKTLRTTMQLKNSSLSRALQSMRGLPPGFPSLPPPVSRNDITSLPNLFPHQRHPTIHPHAPRLSASRQSANIGLSLGRIP